MNIPFCLAASEIPHQASEKDGTKKMLKQGTQIRIRLNMFAVKGRKVVGCVSAQLGAVHRTSLQPNLPNGIYLVSLKQQNRSVMNRFILAR